MKKLLVLTLGTTMVLSSYTLAFARSGGMMGNDSQYCMTQAQRRDYRQSFDTKDNERVKVKEGKSYRNEEFNNYMLDKGYTYDDMRNFTKEEMLKMHAEFEGVSVDELQERVRMMGNRKMYDRVRNGNRRF